MSAERARRRREERDLAKLAKERQRIEEYVGFAGSMGVDYDPLVEVMKTNECLIIGSCYDVNGYTLTSDHVEGCERSLVGEDGLNVDDLLLDPMDCECGGVGWLAHELMFYTYKGYVPEAIFHTCGNKRCANVYHLMDIGAKPGPNSLANRDKITVVESIHCQVEGCENTFGPHSVDMTGGLHPENPAWTIFSSTAIAASKVGWSMADDFDQRILINCPDCTEKRLGGAYCMAPFLDDPVECEAYGCGLDELEGWLLEPPIDGHTLDMCPEHKHLT